MENASVEQYTTVIEIMSHIFERTVKMHMHALDNSHGICEEDQPLIGRILAVGVDDVTYGPIVESVL